MEFYRWQNFFVVLLMVAALTSGVSFVAQEDKKFFNQVSEILNNQDNILASSVGNTPLPPPPPKKLSNPPEIIKAVYVTGWSAGTKSYLNYLSSLFKNTEINAVVVDIKDYSGLVSYKSGAEDVKKYKLYNNAIYDIDALIRFFHNQNIYVIGRIAVFEDPAYSKARPKLAVYDEQKTIDLEKPILWKDNNGLSWTDPASKDVWDYNISIAKDALYHGFDEINFDYIRFPSDGNMKNMGFPIWDEKKQMSKTIKEFFHYLRTNLSGEKISADLFGLTTVNADDMGIGQILENAFENFDYISPMVYPSHYADGFKGFQNPAEHPYEVVKYSMDSARARQLTYANLFLKNKESAGSPAADSKLSTSIILAKLRPWLQDFDMGADYTAEMVKQEIKAVEDSLKNDFNGFMLWNPSNVYTKEAILK